MNARHSDGYDVGAPQTGLAEMIHANLAGRALGTALSLWDQHPRPGDVGAISEKSGGSTGAPVRTGNGLSMLCRLLSIISPPWSRGSVPAGFLWPV